MQSFQTEESVHASSVWIFQLIYICALFFYWSKLSAIGRRTAGVTKFAL